MKTNRSWIKGFIAGFIAAVVFSTGIVYAGGGLTAVTAYFNSALRITYNGLAFNPQEADGSAIPAILYNNRTYLPVRAVAEQSGIFVDYDDRTSEVILRSENELLNRANLVLHYLKYRDFQQLSPFVHKNNGVTFSPYAYTEDDAINFTPAQMAALKADDRYMWGFFDGSGFDIDYTVEEYISRFVYDDDFIQAPTIGVNTLIQTGNTISNLEEAYPGARFVEYHIPGVNPDYGGMDWKSLRLVFLRTGGQWMLTGVVHDQWTI